MIIRSLDTNGDWTFGVGKNNYLSGQLAIMENIQTRLNCFLNNCFFDMSSGLDWFRLLGTPGTKEEIVLTVRATVLQSYGVINLGQISVAYVEPTRALTLQCTGNTVFTSNAMIIFSTNLQQFLGG